MKITITYPESWAEVKYSQYIRYYNTVKPFEGTEEVNRVSLEAAALHFCNVPAEYLYQLPQDRFERIATAISKLFEDSKKHPLTNQFELYGTTYGFIPDLNDISYGEYLDLVNYTGKDLWDNIPIIMSILYRPVKLQMGRNYTIEPYRGTTDSKIEMFKESLTMDTVFGSIGFFLNLYQDLLTGILHYSKEILEKKGDRKTLALLQDLEKSGLDITQLPSLLTTTLQSSMPLQKPVSTNVLHS